MKRSCNRDFSAFMTLSLLILFLPIFSLTTFSQVKGAKAKNNKKETGSVFTSNEKPRYRYRVVNMIPSGLSNETWQDSEPNLAVNPQNSRQVVGSAFTPNPSGDRSLAPIFNSTDGGNTWVLNNIIPSRNGMTGDISLKFGSNSGTLYAGILQGGSNLDMNILRSNPFSNTTMELLVTRNQVDQPYVTAITSKSTNNQVDRVFVGNNDLGSKPATASIERSADVRSSPPPSGFTKTVIESRQPAGQDMPSIRCAVHPSGIVYGLFAAITGFSGTNLFCNITVVRDDNFATGSTPFAHLADPGDKKSGIIVKKGVNMPFINRPALGQHRLGSHMSIAVDPSNAAIVYIAWTDRTGSTGTNLHVHRSTDSGVTWSEDLLNIPNAINPALAINSSGDAACIYQQLQNNSTWETHFRRLEQSNWQDNVLSKTPDNNPPPQFQPYLGDYCDLLAVGKNFYGVFSASNIPDKANFPEGVKYQRNADFSTKRLKNLSNTADVDVSIDPFFFAVEELAQNGNGKKNSKAISKGK